MKTTIIFAASFLLASCSFLGTLNPEDETYTYEVPSRQQAFEVLAETSASEVDYASLTYTAVTKEEGLSFSLGNPDQVAIFEDGQPSFYQAYELDFPAGLVEVSLSSYVVRDQFFVPNVVTLDADFQVIRTFNSSFFPYQPARMLEPDRLEGTFDLVTSDYARLPREKYLVIYTTRDDLEGKTEVLHPFNAQGRSYGRTEYSGVPNPIVPHSPAGLVTMSFDVDVDVNKPVPIYSKVPRSEQERMEQLSTLDNRTADDAIRRMVQAGQIAEAYELMERERAAGSESAEPVFKEALSETK